MIQSPAMQHVESMSAPEWWLRSRAATALGESTQPQPAAVQALANALQDENQYVRLAAAEAIEKLGPKATDAADALIDFLAHNNDTHQIKQAATKALAALGPQVAPTILSYATKEPKEFHRHNLEALAAMGKDVVPLLVEQLKDPQCSIQRQILWVLRKMGPDAAGAAETLEQVALQTEGNIRQEAIEVLADIGDSGLPSLINLLPCVYENDQIKIAEHIYQIGDDLEKYIPELIEILPVLTRMAVGHIAIALGRLGQKSKIASPVLFQLLDKIPDYNVALAIGMIGKSNLNELIKRLQTSPNEMVPLYLEALSAMELTPSLVTPIALPLLNNPKQITRRKALDLLRSAGVTSPELAESLAFQLGQESSLPTDTLLNAFVDLGPQAAPALPALRAALLAKEQRNHEQYFNVLVNIGQASIPLLEELLSHTSDVIRMKAAESLGKLGKLKEKACLTLIELIENPQKPPPETNQIFGVLENFTLPESVVMRCLEVSPNKIPTTELFRLIFKLHEKTRQRVLTDLFHSLSLEEKEQVRQRIDAAGHTEQQPWRDVPKEPHPDYYEPAMQALALLNQSLHWMPGGQLASGKSQALDPEEFVPDEGIQPPFNPANLRVEYRPMTLDLLLERIQHDELDVAPSFQRKHVWSDDQKSLLIESLMLRIPLPSFYFDATNNEKWLVIDGQQRLTAIKEFILDKAFKLDKLEFFVQYEDHSFDELPRHVQRRIRETQLMIYTVESGTTADLKFNIYKRINTGGTLLTAQEIRHAVYQGQAANLLADLAASEVFEEATQGIVPDERMEARELILRWAAFALHTTASFEQLPVVPRYETFLNEAMKQINELTEEECTALRNSFIESMKSVATLLGRAAFRRHHTYAPPHNPINPPLFEAWSVNLSHLTPSERELLQTRRKLLRAAWSRIRQEDRRLMEQMTTYPNKQEHMEARFRTVRRLIEEVLQEPQASEQEERSLSQEPDGEST